MEVEPPVATLPLRVPAAFSAVEEAAEATEEAVVEAEEAEPPQAVRAAAAATVPQTARNERRVIFFIIFSSRSGRAPARQQFMLCLCFSWERLYCIPPAAFLRPWQGKMQVNLLGAGPGLCKELVNWR
jgi:hypothetical protein